ncbi:hypothetical protein [Sediminibacterium sp.]|uniref:hypothetical protein n=1 Tax=Sediminibacterium sp. TaxID=1917865 RepID=UPI003F6A4FF7
MAQVSIEDRKTIPEIIQYFEREKFFDTHIFLNQIKLPYTRVLSTISKVFDSITANQRISHIYDPLSKNGDSRKLFNRIKDLEINRHNKNIDSLIEKCQAEILFLPNSKDKVDLLLELSLVKISHTDYYNSSVKVSGFCTGIANSLFDPFEKGYAYISIGKYLSIRKLYKEAIFSYSSAYKIFSKAFSINTKRSKSALSATALEIANLHSEIDISYALEKSIFYYSESERLLLELQMPDYATTATLRKIQSSIFLFHSPISVLDNGIMDSSHQHSIQQLFSPFLKKDKVKNYEVLSRINYCVAVLLEKNKSLPLTVEKYYLEAIFWGVLSKNNNLVLSVLSSLTSFYINTKRNDPVQANDLFLKISSQLDNYAYNAIASLDKAVIYYNNSQPNLADAIVNRFIYNSEWSSTFYYPYKYWLTKEALQIKIDNLPNAKKDSLSYFQSLIKDYQLYTLEEFTNTVSVEGSLFNLILKEASIDEINYQKNLVEIKNNQQKQSILIIVLGAIIALGVVGYFLQRRADRHKSEKKLAEQKHKIKEKALQDKMTITKNMISIRNHNLVSHYHKISLYLVRKEWEKVEKYCERNASYFENHYSLNLKDQISLFQELENFSLFIEAEKIIQQVSVNIEKNIAVDNPADVVFLLDVFSPLYENAVKYAFTDNSKKNIFSISVTRNKDLLVTTITNTGNTIWNIEEAMKKRPNSYLNMLRNLVFLQFEYKDIQYSESDVFEIINSHDKTTIITLKIPYATA